METKPIKDFTVDDKVDGFFVVRRKEVLEFTRGKYIRTELGDASGRIQGIWWDPDQFGLSELEEGMVVKVRGQVTEYHQRVQLTIQKMRLALDDEFDVGTILRHSPQTKEWRQARLTNLTEKVENSYIKNLMMAFWEDSVFLEKYLNAAAGKLWHHAYIGGLSEHSANVAELALRVAQGYDYLNRDYLIFGGLLHDVGKVDTYTSDTYVIDYTTEGRLVGHLCMADEWICRRANRIASFPDKLLTKLRHLILSHHGALEHASPVLPQMPEAFVLYFCDEIDSKLGAISRIRDKQDGPGWSEWVKLMGRFLYFDDEKESGPK